MKKTAYNLSHFHNTTTDIGKIIPIACYEVLPGDILQQYNSVLVRMTQLNSPVMTPMMISIHSYFVPNRIIWDDWESFITGGLDGLDASVHPYIDLNGSTVAQGDLIERLGMANVGTYAAASKPVNALPLRAYQSIIEHNYMDPDLSTAPTIDTTDGQDTTTTTTLASVCYEKDFATTARTFQHRGDDVTIDLTGSVPITGSGVPTFNYASQTNQPLKARTSLSPDDVIMADNSHVGDVNISWNTPNLIASLASVGTTFEDLMLARAQWLFQRHQGNYGSDYEEMCKRAFGTAIKDGRLQKPEYLGGGRQIIQFSEAMATDGANTGTLYGHGLGALRSRRFRRFVPEHGLVLTLLSIRPKSLYADGIHRSMLKETKFDYYTPEFLNIGDQAVKNQEVYSRTASWDGTFGYNQRYYEYRQLPSRISGEMFTVYDHYHAARKFGAEPSLNDAFVKVGAGDIDRVLASSTNDGFLIMAKNNIKALRPVLRVK